MTRVILGDDYSKLPILVSSPTLLAHPHVYSPATPRSYFSSVIKQCNDYGRYIYVMCNTIKFYR